MRWKFQIFTLLLFLLKDLFQVQIYYSCSFYFSFIVFPFINGLQGPVLFFMCPDISSIFYIMFHSMFYENKDFNITDRLELNRSRNVGNRGSQTLMKQWSIMLINDELSRHLVLRGQFHFHPPPVGASKITSQQDYLILINQLVTSACHPMTAPLLPFDTTNWRFLFLQSPMTNQRYSQSSMNDLLRSIQPARMAEVIDPLWFPCVCPVPDRESPTFIHVFKYSYIESASMLQHYLDYKWKKMWFASCLIKNRNKNKKNSIEDLEMRIGEISHR